MSKSEKISSSLGHSEWTEDQQLKEIPSDTIVPEGTPT